MDEIAKVAEELIQLVQSWEDKLLGMTERCRAFNRFSFQ
jgi:hypothetical protein